MCKHIAATLYGVGHRLDHQPELLFELRQVDHLELIAQAASPMTTPKSGKQRTLAIDQLGEVFGIQLDTLPTGATLKPADARADVPRAVKPRVSSATKKLAKPKQRKARSKTTVGAVEVAK